MSDVPSSPGRPVSAGALAAFEAVLREGIGDDLFLTDPQDVAPYLEEWRNLYRGQTPFVLRPRSTQEVAAVVRAAAAHDVPLVPQGGNSGLVGGQIPVPGAGEVVVSLCRLDTIETIDTEGDTVLVGAGAILADVQRAAEAAGRLFPLSLASEGSARIGGLISTNAGGTGVLAYGNMRDQVLGLEVVLADGRVWNGLRALRKDNTGYDLKHLFIGAEGTLGILTRARLKLAPRPAAQEVAFLAVPTPRAALAVLARARGALGPSLTAFELIPRFGLSLVLEHAADTRSPFAGPLPPWAVLVEASAFSPDQPVAAVLEGVLAAAYEAGEVGDAVLARSLTEARDFWRLRELLSQMQGHAGGSIKHDVSVPVARVPRFLEEADEAARRVVPGARPVPFGHLGDGNIHFNVSQPEGADTAAFLARWDEMNAAVHAVVRRYGGSIAAEHGVGRLKRHLLPTVRSDVELDLMRAVKAAFDPGGIMNPGRVLPDPSGLHDADDED